jgi:hypothetical protein
VAEKVTSNDPVFLTTIDAHSVSPSRSEHGRGIGKGLLKDALRCTAQAADIAGMRVLFVIAKDDEAQRFYEHFNFDPSPADQHQLFPIMKDLKRMVSASGQTPCSSYANPEFGHPTETMCPKVESMITLIM